MDFQGALAHLLGLIGTPVRVEISAVASGSIRASSGFIGVLERGVPDAVSAVAGSENAIDFRVVPDGIPMGLPAASALCTSIAVIEVATQLNDTNQMFFAPPKVAVPFLLLADAFDVLSTMKDARDVARALPVLPAIADVDASLDDYEIRRWLDNNGATTA